MGRRPNLIPSILLNVAVPLDLMTRLNAHLYSELESRVPHGAYKEFFTERIREFFEQSYLDLSPFFNVPPGAYVVRGTPEVITDLERKLSHE